MDNCVKYENIINAIKSKDWMELYTLINKVINNFSFSQDEFIQYIIGDQRAKLSFGKIASCWLQLQSENQYYDARNEYSVKTCKKIISVQDIDKLLPELNEEDIWIKEFCEKMNRNHRTLQQTFTSVVFYYFHCIWQNTNVAIENLFVDNWWKCPLI